MRRFLVWIIAVVVLVGTPLLRVHAMHRSDAILRGYVSICPGDTRDHVIAIIGTPALESHSNLHVKADYELRYKIWVPWPNEWAVGFRGNVVVDKSHVPFSWTD
jgi:hypothetical protein